MDDKEIVALSGAHTLGRAWKDRSGLGAEQTKFTDGSAVARKDGKVGIGKSGGSSWTEKWLTFDNSYFKTVADDNADKELLKMSTDKVSVCQILGLEEYRGFRSHKCCQKRLLLPAGTVLSSSYNPLNDNALETMTPASV